MENEPIHRWLAWLDENSNLGSRPPELIAEIVGNDEAIRAAEEKLVYVTGSREEIRAYEMHRLAQWDQAAREDFVREEGLVAGREEGRAETNLEIARKLKAMGMTAEQIHSITGLSVEDIEGL